MLPSVSNNGARLAAILPTALATLAPTVGVEPHALLRAALPHLSPAEPTWVGLSGARPIRAVILLVVDGLGASNLRESRGHARTLSRLPGRRIETVVPSTTGAALTSLTTGRLPGAHGLIGYRIRHPELGLRNVLSDWHGIAAPGEWQRADPLFVAASAHGIPAFAVGRPAHATGGLTAAILRGAEYRAGATIEDRFAEASRLVRTDRPSVIYLYVDELDRAAHAEGWQSGTWRAWLERLDSAVDELLRGLPGDVGLLVTADHGMLDVPETHRMDIDTMPEFAGRAAEFGGEPRMRLIYPESVSDADELAAELGQRLGKRAWVRTRRAAISAGWYGDVAAEVEPRLGEVIVAARGRYAMTLSTDPPAVRSMIGQHGGLSDEERGIPLLYGGAYADSGFASMLTRVASLAGV